jgi:hypothetical protein
LNFEESSKVLHEWQEELMVLASFLKGDDGKFPDCESEQQATKYVQTAVDSYLKK